jgi:hypothetical protein
MSLGQEIQKVVKKLTAHVGDRLRIAFHIGFIPMVIVMGMRAEPRPELSRLISFF